MPNSTNDQGLPSLVFYSLSGPDALSFLRVLGPATLAGFKIINGVENGSIRVGAVSEGDIVLLQRDICKYYEQYEQIISLAHAEKKPVVFDLDDLLFDLPENHPDRISGFYIEALLPMLQAIMEADLVTVATETLRLALLPYNRNIEIIPNYLSDNLWRFKEFSPPSDLDDIITIGYMGGKSHQPDLMMVLPALKAINEKYPGRIRFHFWGIEPPEELTVSAQVDWSPPEPYVYQKFVNFFQTQTADIVIAPLDDNLFNACKSPIKFFEYSANGMPGVYSNIKPYSNVISDGMDGFLAASNDEWVESLSHLIDDSELRKKFVSNAQKKIKKTWLLSQNFHKQTQIYQGIYQKRNNLPIKNLVNLTLIRNLSAQYFEAFKNRKEQTRHQLISFQEYEKTIQLLANQTDEDFQLFHHYFDQLTDKQQMIEALTEQVTNQQIFTNSLSNQIAENKREIQLLSHKTDEQRANIQDLMNLNAELTNEAVSYSLSKSWSYTRPFRRIVSKLRKAINI